MNDLQASKPRAIGTVDEFVAARASALHAFQQVSTHFDFRLTESKGLPKGGAPGPEPDSSTY